MKSLQNMDCILGDDQLAIEAGINVIVLFSFNNGMEIELDQR